MAYKSINALMKHLRKNGIKINGSFQKIQLINNGYFHGYKGYRFFRNSSNRLPITSYSEINNIIDFDSKLKSLFYEKLMYIETAVKSISTESIIEYDDSESIEVMLSKAVPSYINCPPSCTEEQRNSYQKKKIKLEILIKSTLSKFYKNDSINHYYKTRHYKDVPLWALINSMMLGEFGQLIETLSYDVRNKISINLNIPSHYDQQRMFVYDTIFLLKDLRNAVAHNLVIFDARFKTSEPSAILKNTIKNELHLVYINFSSIDDYIILVSYLLKKLGVSNREITVFIKKYIAIVESFVKETPTSISSIVIKNDSVIRMNRLITEIKNL